MAEEPEHIPDEALVVRCGKPPFDGRPLHLSCDPVEDVYGFSVQSRSGVALADLAAWCGNNRVGVMTVGLLRSFGYDVVVTGGEGYHATVVVPRDWSPEAALCLANEFKNCENPVPKGSRRR